MKKAQRILLFVVVLAVAVSSVFTVMAVSSASSKVYDIDYTCSCSGTTDGEVDSYIDDFGSYGTAGSFARHDNASGCSYSYGYVSATVWHYPGTQSNYNRTTRTASDTENGGGAFAAMYVYDGTGGIGEIFCIESNHTLRLTCNGVQRTYSKYICNGEPAMK